MIRLSGGLGDKGAGRARRAGRAGRGEEHVRASESSWSRHVVLCGTVSNRVVLQCAESSRQNCEYSCFSAQFSFLNVRCRSSLLCPWERWKRGGPRISHSRCQGTVYHTLSTIYCLLYRAVLSIEYRVSSIVPFVVCRVSSCIL